MKRLFLLFLMVAAGLVMLLGCSSTTGETADVDEAPLVEEVKEMEATEEPFSHISTPALAGPFEKPQAVTAACLTCHEEQASDFMKTTHWTWQGSGEKMVGWDGQPVGKMTTINNFCVAVDSNEARCTQCHAGYGWRDRSFDFEAAESIDCLVCHDTSGQYKKNPKAAGMPFEDVDLVASAQSVGEPTRQNCGACHFFAGGGDNVKKGDLGTALIDPAPEVDVHMGKYDFSCQDCHGGENHEIRGSSLHAAVSNGTVTCTECHDPGHGDNAVLAKHTESVSCQTCHIPAFSRAQATKMYWDWSTAGKKDADGKGIATKDENGYPKYDSKKGDFVYEQNVRPAYAWWNGGVQRMLLGDTYDQAPVDLASPVGSIDDPDSKIYPFKIMKGNQGADPVNKVILVPHLFPGKAGENAYWKKWDWGKAFEEGMSYAGLPYSGSYEWIETEMHMAIHHEVAPKEQALDCMACHSGGIDFTQLGYSGDPMIVGGRKD